MKSIKYIGFYNLLGSEQERNGSLAAINKMNYLAESMSKIGRKVEIISPSWTLDEDIGYTTMKNIKIKDNIYLTLGPSLGTKNKVIKKFRSTFSRIWIFIYIMLNVKRGEEIIVYHSLPLIKPLLVAKKLRKFKLILEVEEIYTDVINYGKRTRINEFKMINSAEKYIFPTELLNEKINKESKPYCIVYGTYKVEENRKCKCDDDKIHVVYAGTFDPRKGGATSAASASEYLDEKYHVHIIGFGSDDDKSNLQSVIEAVSKKTKATVTFDGLYTGEEYIKFLQSCDIGLSTQNPNAEYNDTSFPSKVLSYMSNGLRVVSIRIKVLERAKIRNLLYFYDNDSPKSIADAIKKIKLSEEYNSRKIIKELDKEFRKEIGNLLER